MADLHIADDLGGTYGGGFVNGWGGCQRGSEGVCRRWNPTVPKTPSKTGAMLGVILEPVEGVIFLRLRQTIWRPPIDSIDRIPRRCKLAH